jgi:predicted DNA-binding protein (MmcQ/YjbR family)
MYFCLLQVGWNMTYQELLTLLALKPEAEECYPFYPDVPVFKIKGKVFAIASQKDGQSLVNLKCNPDWSEPLRMMFEAVKPAFHMNKRHWNSLYLDGDLPDSEFSRLIDHSYALVVKGLKVPQRKSLELEYGPDAIYKNNEAGVV